MKKPGKSSLTTQYIVVFGVLLLLANAVLGVLLLQKSSSMVQSLIRRSMLSVSDTAADLVDGDALGAFTEEDVDTPAYREVYNSLAAFQNNTNIIYIYAVRQTGADQYVFIVDPDPVSPALFGEEVVLTEALRQAGRGHSAVDEATAEDRWGDYYSAFSPVLDSQGKVSGIIGVDFDSTWYNEQIWMNTLFIILFSVLFTLVGAVWFVVINGRVRRRFSELNAELATLSADVESLTEELFSDAGYADSAAPSGHVPRRESAENSADDEIRTLGRKIRAMHREMELYLDYVHAQVYTDTLTRVGNTTAYLERQKALEAKILDGSARFSAVMFDINDLKRTNDRFGHACGDKMIRAAASAIAESFEMKNTYRIGGDEFIAIVEETDDETLDKQLARVDEAIDAFNRTNPENEAKLSLSKGHAGFRLGQDHAFRDVFVRADMQMYERKDSYHRRNRASAPEEQPQ